MCSKKIAGLIKHAAHHATTKDHAPRVLHLRDGLIVPEEKSCQERKYEQLTPPLKFETQLSPSEPPCAKILSSPLCVHLNEPKRDIKCRLITLQFAKLDF